MTFKQYLKEPQISEYELFLEVSNEYETLLLEGNLQDLKIPDKLKEAFGFIKNFSQKIGMGFLDVLKIFKEKSIFELFKEFNWDLNKVLGYVKKGYQGYKTLINEIGIFISKNKAFNASEEQIRKLQVFLDNNPKIKKISGLVLAGLLIYVWTNTIAFTGDVDFDFDQEALFQAIRGNVNLVDLLTGPEGAKFLTFVTAGGLLGLSFPWPGSTPILFGGSLIYTLIKKKYPKQGKVIKNFLKGFLS